VCPLRPASQITATRCAGQSDEDSEVPTRRILVICSWEGQEGCCVNSHGDRGAGLAAEDLGGFSPWTRCAVSWELLSFESHSFRFWGTAFWSNQGGNRKRSSWMDLFVSLDNSNTNAFRPPSNSLSCLFSRTSFVTRALLSLLSISLSISVDGARGGGGTCWKGVGRVYGLWTRSSLPSNCLAGEPAATCKIALNDGQASICWETSFGPALFLFLHFFTVQFKTGSFS